MVQISTSKVTAFLVFMKLLYARILGNNYNKLVVCKFYHAVYHFRGRVRSSTCTTYSKYLRNSIITVLTPNNNDNVSFNVIIPADRGWQFCSNSLSPFPSIVHILFS